MRYAARQAPRPADGRKMSPLLLADQLITLAEQAGDAGYRDAARRLVALACDLVEHAPLFRINAGPAGAARRRYRSHAPALPPGH
jgi:hypothetical protein